MKRQVILEELDDYSSQLPHEILASILRFLRSQWCLLVGISVSQRWRKVIREELQSLQLLKPGIVPHTLIHSRMPNITALSMLEANSLRTADYFEELTGLRKLIIHDTDCDLRDVEHKGLLTCLVNLTYMDCNLKPGLLMPLAKDMTTLKLTYTDMDIEEVILDIETSEGQKNLSTLSQLTKLKKLTLFPGFRSYDKLITHLPSLTSLKINVSDDTNNEMFTVLSSLTSLYYHRDDILHHYEESLLKYLPTTLRNLSLYNSTPLYEEGVSLPSLVSLDVASSLNFIPERFTRLLPNLSSLICRKLTFSEAVVYDDLKKLTRLQVKGREYCHEGVLLRPVFDLMSLQNRMGY